MPSIIIHGALIVLAIHLTESAHATVSPSMLEAIIPIPLANSRQGEKLPAPSRARAGHGLPPAVPALPQRIPAPAIDVPPPDLPNVDQALNHAFTLASTEDFAAKGIGRGGHGKSPGTDDGAPSGSGDSGQTFTEFAVDRPVSLRDDSGKPIYPATLRTAGIEGEVVATFVVDTTGRVLPASITILRSANELFTSSVRIALMKARFNPATIGPRKVAQLVQQSFSFTLR